MSHGERVVYMVLPTEACQVRRIRVAGYQTG